jgi:hypothetical protein
MDDIDFIRNEILRDLNLLLEKCGEPTFALITLSNQIVKGAQSDRLHQARIGLLDSDLLILRRVLSDGERRVLPFRLWHP